VLHGHCFSFNAQFYKPDAGAAVAAPASGLANEILFQYFEHAILKYLIEDGFILCYIRCADDSLVVFNHEKLVMKKFYTD
jgi:hypothetical protein